MAIKKPVKKKATSRGLKKSTKKTTTKKTATKKPVAKKPAAKKPIKKKPVKKKPAAKKTKLITQYPLKKNIPPVTKRKEIKLSSKVYHELLQSTSHNDDGFPYVWLLGEDGKQIVRHIEPLEQSYSDGCGEMPSLDSYSLYKAYLNLNDKKLVPIGLARTGSSFNNDAGNWSDSSGIAIYSRIGYMLTVAQEVITGQVFVPRGKFKNKHEDNFGSGRLEQLTVLLTDK